MTTVHYRTTITLRKFSTVVRIQLNKLHLDNRDGAKAKYTEATYENCFGRSDEQQQS